MKCLGIFIDDDLTFNHNVSLLCRKAFFSLKQLFPYKHLLDSKTKLLLCESLVLSLLSYGDIVYGPYISYLDKLRLQKMQNICIRFTTYVPPYTHVTPYLREFHCLKLQERRFLHYVAFVFEIIRTGLPVYLFDKLSRRSTAHNLNLRHIDSMYTVPAHSTSFFKRGFSYLAVHLYNELVARMPNTSLTSLKGTLKERMLSDGLHFDIGRF